MEPATAPFTVLVDQREKLPYEFRGFSCDADQKYRPLYVPTKTGLLKTGDYSIVGLEHLVTVERKTKEDLFSTLGQHRERFEAEHERMAEMALAIVLIEAELSELLHCPPPESRLLPKTVIRTKIAWETRYGVLWVTGGCRQLSEILTFRYLERFWKEREKHGEAERESDHGTDYRQAG